MKNQIKKLLRSNLKPSQVQTLKKAVNRSRELSLRTREFVLDFGAEKRPVTNLFHACVQKTGSQWIRAVLSDPRIQSLTGLATFPQFRYEWGEFRRRFPRYTYVPGLYISRGLYEEIDKPTNYRTIYVTRDPRNVVISWYYSMRDTHSLMGKVPEHREVLQEKDFESGLLYCIRQYHLKFAYMRSWAYARDDSRTLFIKLEDLTENPVDGFGTILKHCGIRAEQSLLAEVMTDYTKEKMRQRDLKSRTRDRSHYRQGSTDWRKIFTEEHRDVFKEVTGNLPELLGYSPTDRTTDNGVG